MKVGIYIGSEGPFSGGSHSFVRAVLEGLDGMETGHELEVLHSGFDDVPRVGHIPVRRVAAPKRTSMVKRVTEKARRTDTRAARDKAIAAELDALGFHLMWFLTPATLPTTLPYVATVWDLAHRVEPQFPEVSTTGWTWEARESHYRRWLPRASYVVVGASSFAEDVSRCYGVSPARIRVMPLVAPIRSTVRADRSAQSAAFDPRFLFYPAQFWPHKNHIGLLLALKEARERHGVDVRLVLTGSDKGNLAHVRAAVANLGLEPHVSFEGFVTDERLASLYRDALALVFPSFFGPDNLPPLEAMQLGCPVLAANVPGASEQLGDAALLMNHRSVDDMTSAIVRIAKDPALRDSLIARGRERVKQWGPTDYAAALLRTVDEFETERRCWSYTAPYVHT